MKAEHESRNEISRLRSEYARRDAAGLSDIYTYADPAFAFHMQEREWAILRLLRESRVSIAGFRILEVGCGTGHILERFLELGAGSAAGIDLADHRIRIAKKRYPRLLFSHGNAAELPFADGAFDMVMQFMCLSSVLDAEMRRRIAREMWRVVRPGGTVLHYDLRPSPFLARILLFPFFLGKHCLSKILPSTGSKTAGGKESPPTPIRCLTIQELRKLFPEGPMRYRSVSLNYDLARIAGASLLAAQLLSRIPFLRSHYLALIRKPA